MIDFYSMNLSLTPHQRNLLRYIQYHKEKYPTAPCFIPRQSYYQKRFLHQLEVMETKKLIKVKRTGQNYMQWEVSLYKPFGRL